MSVYADWPKISLGSCHKYKRCILCKSRLGNNCKIRFLSSLYWKIFQEGEFIQSIPEAYIEESHADVAIGSQMLPLSFWSINYNYLRPRNVRVALCFMKFPKGPIWAGPQSMRCYRWPTTIGTKRWYVFAKAESKPSSV